MAMAVDGVNIVDLIRKLQQPQKQLPQFQPEAPPVGQPVPGMGAGTEIPDISKIAKTFVAPDPNLRGQGSVKANEFRAEVEPTAPEGRPAIAPPPPALPVKSEETVKPPVKPEGAVPTPKTPGQTLSETIRPIPAPTNRGLFGISGWDWLSLLPGKAGQLFAGKAESMRENAPALEIGGQPYSARQLAGIKSLPEWASRYLMRGTGGGYNTQEEATAAADTFNKAHPGSQVDTKYNDRTGMWENTYKGKTKVERTFSSSRGEAEAERQRLQIANPDRTYKITQHAEGFSVDEAPIGQETLAKEQIAFNKKLQDAGITIPTTGLDLKTVKDKAQQDLIQEGLASGALIGESSTGKVYRKGTQFTMEAGEKRAEAFAKTRQVNVFDTRQMLPDGSPNPGYGSVFPLDLDTVTKANKEKPGTFLSGPQATKALQQHTFLTEMEGAIDDIRGIMGRRTWKDFNTVQLAKLGELLKSAPRGGVVKHVMDSAIFNTLATDQQDFILALFSAKESAMGMRTILGGGSGSDLVREAIDKTLPGFFLGTTKVMQAQLNAFTRMTMRLRAGIANPKLAEMKTPTKELPSISVEKQPGPGKGGPLIPGMPTPLTPVAPVEYKSLEEIQAAIKDGKISREDGVGIAKQKGWVK